MATSGKNLIKTLLSSKIFLFFLAMILIVVLVGIGKESYRKYQLTQEIKRLKMEIERIEGRNEQLANLMEYFKDDSYLEKEARLKLNLKKPGEQVVILSDKIDKNSDEIDSTDKNTDNDIILKDNTGRQLEETANYWKWWEYFFGSS